MGASQYDVLVVGAGAAGLTAAIGLARAGFSVAAVEAAPFPGAENWSGCVYFCENLAHPDILGPEGVEALAWERRLIERGFFASDGHSLLGMKYRDPAAFQHCYTVLRPIYDHHLACVARRFGVALLTNTTAESLIRDGRRVVGIATNRGPLYADLVFLAEGDASHLVTREGYERFPDHREMPKFLQGIKQVVDLPPGAIEEIFGVGAEEGVAYEILLRNGTLHGRSVHLNMGGFVYTNRQSLSVGLVLPADNLSEHFGGDPNLLLEWFENLPALQPWLRQGQRGVFGAKLIRGGGAKDIPTLIDEGLAIGGAASAIGVDFPYPNFTGPATAMGLLLAQAASRIRAAGGGFTRENLRRHYLEPLEQTHYWKDVEFLRRWPGYVKRTQVFFGRNLDLVLGTAYVWTRPQRWLLTRWTHWLRLILHVAGPGHWRGLQRDFQQLLRALRLREVVSRPALGRLLLDGTINALRDLAGSPRANLPPAGTVTLHYTTAEVAEALALPPASCRRWFQRLAPVLAAAARRIYANDTTPLAAKLPEASQLLLRQINMLDLLGTAGLALAAGLSSGVLVVWDRLLGALGRRRRKTSKGIYPSYAQAVRQATDLTSAQAPAAAGWDARLAQLAYQTIKASHIHVLWPRLLQKKDAVVQNGLWHVCPARVYEARVDAQGHMQVITNFENCIKCESCWRTSDLVDWARDGRHRFIYPVGSPVVARLLEMIHATGASRPAAPLALSYWEPTAKALAEVLTRDRPAPVNGHTSGEIAEFSSLVEKLDRKLEEFDVALAREPRTVDRARAEFLEMLARYAQQFALRLVEILRNGSLAESAHPSIRACHEQLLHLTTALLAKAEERARRTWDQRFAWAAADGRQMRQHHLAGIRRVLGMVYEHYQRPAPEADPTRFWLLTEDQAQEVAARRAEWGARLDAVFPPTAWRDLERQVPLTSEQDAVLRDLLAQVPRLDPAALSARLHPPLRKALLAELGRRDPSLAYRAASHLWARDLAGLRSPGLALTADRWARGEEWACFAAVDAVQSPDGRWKGTALFVPASQASSLLVLAGNQLAVLPSGTPGLRIEHLPSLGLRGAGLARIALDNVPLSETRVTVDHDRIRRVWQVVSAADLVSIASGMADELCRRAIDHATTRVQFPGLFHDEEARDAIGKFGAIKKMIAEMAARRYLIETLDHVLSPADFSSSSVERAGLIKSLAAEALGTAPGSLAYNAGQIFGGTGYSEDDIPAKFYRDAAAWRFLGLPNTEVYRQHGEQLLRNWHADGRRLANFSQEAQLFDQVVQRKALQAELDELRVFRARLRGLVNSWQEAHKLHESTVASDHASNVLYGSAGTAEIAEWLARQDAHLLAGKALLLRTHARLEHGRDSEIEAVLLRVWLEEAAVSLEAFAGRVQHRLEADARRSDQPLVDPGAGERVATYAEYLEAPCPYDSGDFLTMPTDLAQPRFVPEMIESDPVLAARNLEIRERFAKHFGPPRAGGIPYERYIEQRHRPDPEDLDFCRRHGYFRMLIPDALGGGGRPKVEYYLLTTNAQRLADVAISLTIQANSSIGTTPILLARDKDLPRAQQDIGPFVGDPALQKEVWYHLERLLSERVLSNPKSLEKGLRELHRRLEATVLGRPALRALAHRFVQAWQKLGQAGSALGEAAVRPLLEAALNSWNLACTKAEEMHDELARRREACDLALRWIASGQISAFALTEPSAGSDTARIATRAQLRRVPVQREADGVLRFALPGSGEPRYLLDARRLEFRSDGVSYHWSETEPPASIHFDEYDYETDYPNRRRYYQHGERRVDFTDIAQLRERDGQLWYDYWELSGAKMWITNGRMAGIFCLYAKTEEGVTGFVVDRHAEGLLVGKDEAKMGQLGSPTNELALQAVRVPRENVLGLEGRGQVNALETLNVGRAGIAISSMSPMAGLIERSQAFAQAAFERIPDWVAWRLQRMEEDRFTAEALAHELVGRFDHLQTKSVRMESAIAKMIGSELLHRIIESAEEIYGLAGQTQLHLVEKRKRDARILTIYEGTNEVQRFSILKDLASEVVSRGSAGKTGLPNYLSGEALDYEALKAETRQRLAACLEMFGQDLWRNPNLQANCFLLAEAAGWLKAADSTLARLAWLEREAQADEDAEPSPKIGLARQALARCCTEVRQRLRQFDEELAHLRRGYYAPVVRAASLLFDRAAAPVALADPVSTIHAPLSILVIVEPSALTSPHPLVQDGRLLEPYITLTEGDRAALETALRLRDSATALVTIDVVAVGPRGFAQVLRDALSLGVDRARLLLSDHDALTPDSAARALASLPKDAAGYDLILSGAGGAEDEEGLQARLTTAALGIPDAGQAALLAITKTEGDAEVALLDRNGREYRVHSLPSAVRIEAGLSLRSFSTEGYLAGMARSVECERWPRSVLSESVYFEKGLQPVSVRESEERPRALSPAEAALQTLQQMGLDTTSAKTASFTGIIEDVTQPTLSGSHIVAVVAADESGRLQPTATAVLQAASLAAQGASLSLGIVLLVPRSEENQRQAVASVLEQCSASIVLLPAEKAGRAPEVHSRLLSECWSHLGLRSRLVMGEPWTEGAFAILSRQAKPESTAALRVLGSSRVDLQACKLEYSIVSPK